MVLATLATAAIIATSTSTTLDSDYDGLSDKIEISLGTDPNNSDSDGDKYFDGEEVLHGYNPLGKIGDRKVKKRVEVDLTKQQIHYFFNDVPIGSYYVSTGRLTAKTPTGVFTILRKLPLHYYPGLYVDYPNTKWNLEFKRHYFIHSAYWHNDFGVKPRSGGCVNLTVPDAEQIYAFLDVGDSVKIYGTTPTTSLKLPAGMKLTYSKTAAVK
ncbi:MAG: L,D-transpeptidase family protein [Patescibacteria group bacterium]